MKSAKCPQCGYHVQADWYTQPGGEEFALCPNHDTNIVYCEIVIRKLENTNE